MREVDSSAIQFINYDSGTLTVIFRQTMLIYEFKNVPEEIYQAFAEAESLGKAFNKLIRPKFEGVYRGVFKQG